MSRVPKFNLISESYKDPWHVKKEFDNLRNYLNEHLRGADEHEGVNNATGVHIVKGSVLTYEGGVVDYADASSASTRAFFLTNQTVDPGGKFHPVSISSAILVRTVDAKNIVRGDAVYLSETAGKVTKTQPTTSGAVIQDVGYAIENEGVSSSGLVLIKCFVSPGLVFTI